jgi:hypothetical protein
LYVETLCGFGLAQTKRASERSRSQVIDGDDADDNQKCRWQQPVGTTDTESDKWAEKLLRRRRDDSADP